MVVVNRKVGNQVYYSLRDPVLIEVLDTLRRYLSSQLTDTMNMLEEIGQKESTSQIPDILGHPAKTAPVPMKKEGN